MIFSLLTSLIYFLTSHFDLRRFVDLFAVDFRLFTFDFDSDLTGSSSSLVYHQAAIITKATTTKMTKAVFLSKPEVATGEGEPTGSFVKLTVVTAGGLSDV